MLLGVNVDHVATLRQARGTRYPDPVAAALLAIESGADSITVHLREDRRHIQDHDVERLTGMRDLRVNLEMAVTDEMIGIACQLRPSDVCMVPEKRAELTTEGGLDVVSQCAAISRACSRLNDAGIRVSLFIDPENDQIEAAKHCGAAAIELHTGTYADADSDRAQQRELARIQSAATSATARQLVVNAGHGLHLDNVQPIAVISEIVELNIGHALISQAIFDGLPAVVAEMKRRMLAVRTVS